MADRSYKVCDRCDQKLTGTTHPGLTITINVHHPVTLDLCGLCAKTLPFWLGQTFDKMPLDTILAGHCSGTYIPTKEQIEVFNDSGTIVPAITTGERG